MAEQTILIIEDKAKQAGCSGYISKPIDTRNFAKNINQYISAAGSADMPPHKARPSHTARILIVDDEPMNVKLFAAQLGGNNYEFIAAHGGREAVEKTHQYGPDLILLDIMMPDMDGYTVIEKLKADPQTNNIPVILISALNSPEDKIHGLKLGAEDFLTKPVSRKKLLERVESTLKQEK